MEHPAKCVGCSSPPACEGGGCELLLAATLPIPAPKYQVAQAAGRALEVKHDRIAADLIAGVKFDEGKARFDLIPPEALYGLAQVYTLGAAKYADRNWEKGLKWGRVFAAMMRHAWGWFWGERYDPKDGQHHLLSVAWGAFALYTYELRKVGEDDRPRLKAEVEAWRRAVP